MKKITFKLIPVRYTDDGKSEYLVKEDNSFLSVEISGADYEAEVLKALKREFLDSVVLARSVWVENTESGLSIYTIVGGLSKIEKAGYAWKKLEELDEDNFDEYDEAAISFLIFRDNLEEEES